MNESSCCSTSSPAFGIVSVLDFGHFKCAFWYLIVLICISSMTYDLRHLFIRLFVICVSSSMRHLLRVLVHFLIRLFSCCCLESSLYILDNNTLSDVSFASQCVACLLSLLTLSLEKQKFWMLMKSSVSIISFLDCTFGIISKRSLSYPRSSTFSPMVSFLNCRFWILHLGLWSILFAFYFEIFLS